MNVCVLVKQVPDTETQIKIKDNKVVEDSIKWIISPFDENAIEEAVQQKEKHNVHTKALSYGPKRAAASLRTAMGFGLDEAVHLLADDKDKDKNKDKENEKEEENGFEMLDVQRASGVLAAYCTAHPADIILCGHTAIDSQSSIVPVMLAARLQCAFVTEIVSLEIVGKEVTVHIEADGYLQEVKTQTPVVLSVSKKINEPRYPSLKNIIAAKKKAIETIPASSLQGVSSAAGAVAGDSKSKLEILKLETPPVKPLGRIIEGESVADKAEQLVEALAKEVKVL